MLKPNRFEHSLRSRATDCVVIKESHSILLKVTLYCVFKNLIILSFRYSIKAVCVSHASFSRVGIKSKDPIMSGCSHKNSLGDLSLL